MVGCAYHSLNACELNQCLSATLKKFARSNSYSEILSATSVCIFYADNNVYQNRFFFIEWHAYKHSSSDVQKWHFHSPKINCRVKCGI